MLDVMEIDIDRPEKIVYVVGLGPGEPFYMTSRPRIRWKALTRFVDIRSILTSSAMNSPARNTMPPA